MDRTLIWSYGGGTQSIALAVLVARGELPVPTHIVIADTGREATETWEYTAAHVAPLLATVGASITIIPHDLATVDLYATNGRSLLPLYSAPESRLPGFCSNEWKQRVVRRWLRAQGYGPRRPITLWLGMSVDEIGRVKPSGVGWITHAWPLVFDVTLRRGDCRALILRAGLPEPPKSSCWMCPHRSNAQWARLRDHYPQDWARAVALDTEVRARDKRGGVYLHRSAVPLEDADLSLPSRPPSPLFGDLGDCDSGYCMA